MFYKKLFTIILLFIFGISSAQEIVIPTSISSLGGGIFFDDSSEISEWIVGTINIIEIDDSDLENDAVNELLIYPNPVETFLNFKFKIDSQKEFQIYISDMSGRHSIINKKILIISNETIEINLSNFSSGIYIVRVKSTDLTYDKSLKIFKL